MSNQRQKFVTAFNRDRDSYQVPLALAEAGALDQLITDFYLPSWFAHSALGRRLRVAHRHIDGLRFSQVGWCLPALSKQLIGLRRAESEVERLAVFKSLDRDLSRQAQRRARRSGADLFLYSGYALECFSAPAMVDRRKALFVFHPHSKLSEEILNHDRELHPEMTWSHELHRREMQASDSSRLEAEVALADDLVCASSFTKRSVMHLPTKTTSVTVVPYGCEVPAQMEPRTPATGRPVRVLFVGQGVQRKGIHHLLKVWKSRATWDAELTVIAGRLDPAAGRLAEAPGPAVRLLPALPRKALNAEFGQADIFVMPSLFEGFGLVYLEALAAGCHVIGTENTGLPDLAAPAQAVTIIPAGDLEHLAESLARAIEMTRRDDFSPQDIKRFAETKSWPQFRAGILASIGLRNS
jgi:glycosyltransferase involved in cell wall biosynthesis